ncbi:arylamine N-acetyltransferase [Lentzea sp. JNUCC 0626]|uniref:arylamine N-acetyltransferase family protein n=1 Tax=Lentzea sp. JNUCC 0626 TaxID=3367513 RepID=UPI0037488146
MEDAISCYTDRIGFTAALEPTIHCLRGLHEAHLYNVPFENFSMHTNTLDDESLLEAIVHWRRGGICFETGLLMQATFDACGFDCELRLGSVVTAGRSPATHQVFVVRINGDRWLFDIGFGALGPRGPLRLADGTELVHQANSSRITLDAGSAVPKWTASTREHATNAETWQDLYTFVDAPAVAVDLEMAHFYTTRSPNSLLNKHKVASIPTPTGRISVRDDNLTVASDGTSTTSKIIDRTELKRLLGKHFGLTAPARDLGFEGQPCTI